jgi:hypothetical protein
VLRKVDEGLLSVQLREKELGHSPELEREREQLEAIRQDLGTATRALRDPRTTLKKREERLDIFRTALAERELFLRDHPEAVGEKFNIPLGFEVDVALLRNLVQGHEAVVETHRTEFGPHEELLALWREAPKDAYLAEGERLLASRRKIAQRDPSAGEESALASAPAGSEKLPGEGSAGAPALSHISAASSDDVQEPLPPLELPSIGQVLWGPMPELQASTQRAADGVTVSDPSEERDVRRAQVLENLRRAALHADSERSDSHLGHGFP